MSGVGSLVKDGAGTLTLKGTNSYEGGTVVSDGTLAISQNANLGKAETGVTVSNATLLLNGDIAIERKVTLAGTTATLNTAQDTSSSLDDAVSSLSDVISGSAKLVKEGEGSLTLSGVNTYAGSTDINAGTLVISQDGNLGKAGTGVAINNATLSLNGSVAVDRTIALAGTTATVNTTTGSSSLVKEVSGSAALVKTGAGTLTLNSANSYTGDTQITGGTLAIDANDKLGTGTKVTISDATLALTDTVALNRTLDVTGIATVDTATGSNSSLDKTVNGSGQLVKTGAGTLELTQANSYTGGTAIKAGEIVLGANAALGTGAATFATDTELSFSQGLSVANAVQVDGKVQVHSGQFDSNLDGVVSGVGSLVKDGAGQLSLTQANTYSGSTQVDAGTVAVDANTALGLGAASFAKDTTLSLGISKGVSVSNAIKTDGVITQSNNFDSSLTGVISGAGKLVKDTNATGTLTLTGANSYTGGTSVDAGTVAVDANTALGLGAATFAKDTELSLGISKGVSVANAIKTDGVITQSNSFDSSLTGVISGAGQLVKEGTGLLSLTGANSYSGGTQVAAGKVALDANTALGAGSATFATDTELSLGVTKGLSVANAIEVDGEVDVHSGKFDSSLTGIISGAGSLVKDGTGQLSLTQDNTYSGGTQIAAGKVALDANAALGTGKATFAQNTELSLGVTQGVSVANAVQVDGAIKVHSGQFDSNLDGVVSGVGSLVKDGAGTLTLKGTNIYEGGTVVSDGTLAISQNANLGKAETGVTVSNATLLLNGDIAIERKVTLAGTTATLNTAQDTSSSLDDAVSGTAKLIKTGDGTLTLNTANSYAGGTQIAKGTLAISNDASLGGKAGKFGVDVVIDDAATLALTGNVAAARKLDLTGSTAIIDTAKNTSSSLSDVISGSAKLVKEGEGSLTLSGVNTYAGSTDINAGTLVISQDANLGKAGTGVAINNATLSLNGSVAVDRTIALAGTTATVNTTTGSSSLVKEVSGSAALVKTGAGTLTSIVLIVTQAALKLQQVK
ncbi:MAG: autotransporter-associated beta strand repeat-containing protein [Moraxellaceae bacterium]|nr:autotransporter-associated beta strand repeat-containing protein [Moraxellaceae bacterium]